MKQKHVTLTPELAKHFLTANNRTQRPLDLKRVRRYSKMILAGQIRPWSVARN